MSGEPYAFPQVIRAARERCGLSLSEAADLIDCTKSHVWDMEQGKANNPTIKMLAGIACAYDMDLGVLAHLAAASAPGTDYRRAVVDVVAARKRLAVVSFVP
jgi:transcriptional regulator with XRE-family HTH domain